MSLPFQRRVYTLLKPINSRTDADFHETYGHRFHRVGIYSGYMIHVLIFSSEFSLTWLPLGSERWDM